MLKREPNWLIKHAIQVAIGAIVVGVMGWVAANYGFFLGKYQRTESLRGKVLTMEVPQWWLDNPDRGSIDFLDHDEIESTKKISAKLSVRTEGQEPKWQIAANSKLLYTLSRGERLCDITNSEDNGDNFWIGKRAHCQALDACSFDIEGNILRVTIKDVSLVIGSVPSLFCPKGCCAYNPGNQ